MQNKELFFKLPIHVQDKGNWQIVWNTLKTRSWLELHDAEQNDNTIQNNLFKHYQGAKRCFKNLKL